MISILRIAALMLLASVTLFASAQLPDADGGPIRRGTLPRQWQTGGPKCIEVPDWQVHEYNPDLYILRQSGCTDFEKPFLYLLFGKDKALLFDTGSLNGNLVPTLQLTIHNWLIRNKRSSIPLTVVHSHSHYDHNSGDAGIHAFHDPDIPVTLVPAEIEATKRFYAMPNYPNDITQIDLGGRVLDAIGIPGHTAVDIALYDRQTGILLTGDTIYPGRLFVDDFVAYQASVDRLVRFTDGKVIAHLLGAHVEQTRTPYLDYTFGTMYQPDEHVPELTRGDLLELQVGVYSLNGRPHRLAMPTFTIEPLGPGIDPQVYKDFDARFTANQKQQHAQMWAQPTPR